MINKTSIKYNPQIKRLKPGLKRKPLHLSAKSTRLLNLIYKYSPAGNLIDIARNQKRLAEFNKEAAKLGYQLTIDHDAIVPPKALTPVRLSKI